MTDSFTHLHQQASVYSSELGEFVDERHAHLAQILQDYKPTLSLTYIPKKNRDATDTKPWAIVENHPQTGAHVVRYLSELEMSNPQEVLAWVFEGDLDRHRPDAVLKRIELREAAAKLLDFKKQEEEALDRQELVASLARGGRDRKHWFRHNGRTYRN